MREYEKYMEIRATLIKQGKSLSEATTIAFEEAYHPKGIDPMSYADR